MLQIIADDDFIARIANAVVGKLVEMGFVGGKAESTTAPNQNTPQGLMSNFGKGTGGGLKPGESPAVLPEAPPVYYKTNGIWNAVSFFMVAGMSLEEAKNYAPVDKMQTIHALARTSVANAMFFGPIYLNDILNNENIVNLYLKELEVKNG